MKHKPIPWAILLTGVLYYGLLVYWQSDELQMASGSDPYNAAVFGLLFSVVYLAYCMICFQRDLPSSFKEMPFVGRFGKLTGWLAFASIAVYYVRPAAWGGYDEGVGFFLVGIILLGFGAAAILTCFMWEGDDSSRNGLADCCSDFLSLGHAETDISIAVSDASHYVETDTTTTVSHALYHVHGDDFIFEVRYKCVNDLNFTDR